MAVTAEQLNIILTARDREFQRAMESNARRVERFAARTQRQLSTTGRSFDALASVAKRLAPILAGAFTVQTISNMVRGASEIGKLASVAGVSVDEFQRFAVGAKTVGMEMDKVSDVLKDVNDKVGEFIMNGEGQLKDFFETIAPAVGVTAEQFRKLSGPQALQLYVSSLERAGLSQSEMTFYMEALANDATALIPLLRDNGAEMSSLADEAEAAGRILSQDAVEGARDLEAEMDALRGTIATQLTEAILDHQDDLKSLVGFITESVIPAISGLIEAISNGASQYAKFKAIMSGESYEGEPTAQNNPGDRARDVADFANDDQGYVSPGQTGYFDENMNWVNYGTPEAEKPLTNPAPAIVEPDVSEVIRSGLTPTKSTSKSRGGGGKSAADEAKDLARELERVQDEYKGVLASLDPVVDAQQRYREALAAVEAAMDAGIITHAEAEVANAKLAEQFKEAQFEANGFTEAMNGIQGTMESGLTSILTGQQSVADGVKSMAAQIISDLMRVLVVQRMLGSFSSGGGGLFGRVFSGLAGRASGGAVMAGTAYNVGEHGAEPFVPSVNGRILSRADAKQALSGGGSSTVQIALGEGLVGQILTQAGNQTVQIVQANNAANKSALGGNIQNYSQRGTT